MAGKALAVQKMLSESYRGFAVAKKNGILHTKNSYPLGLPLPQFQDYINTLTDTAGKGELDIHAIVLSNTGRVFKAVSSTAELRNFLTPDLLETKSPEQKLILINQSNPSSLRSTAGKPKNGSSKS